MEQSIEAVKAKCDEAVDNAYTSNPLVMLKADMVYWLIEQVQNSNLEIDDWKQSHDKVARALEKSERDHKETMDLLQDANKDIKEWERISDKQVEHLTRNGKEIISLTEAYFDTLVYLSALDDIAAVHKAIKDIIEDKKIS
ncbi:hypothetical protein MC28_3188 [Bacillus thuringiensis MC28]|nr:hypothetical protein MC28_3188 [Bacillus thuringiensis MC28]